MPMTHPRRTTCRPQLLILGTFYWSICPRANRPGAAKGPKCASGWNTQNEFPHLSPAAHDKEQTENLGHDAVAQVTDAPGAGRVAILWHAAAAVVALRGPHVATSSSQKPGARAGATLNATRQGGCSLRGRVGPGTLWGRRQHATHLNRRGGVPRRQVLLVPAAVRVVLEERKWVRVHLSHELIRSIGNVRLLSLVPESTRVGQLAGAWWLAEIRVA